MCGIAGIFAPEMRVDPADVRLMTDALRHRGPDDTGIEVLGSSQVVLGHRRLSILDLSPRGHQPMMHSSGRLWITFNGEVYNFKSLRPELEALGERFCSGSDTEVLLAAFYRWGAKCLQRLRGMFALGLWDNHLESLLLVRDPFGVKPLYYRVANGQFSFASEIGALLANPAGTAAISISSAAEFLRYGYVSAPRSMFAGIHALPPGCVLTVDRNLRPAVERYWDPSDLFQGTSAAVLRSELIALDEESVLDYFERALAEAFELRLVSDVPVGLFLSGGIDSTVVATLLARHFGLRPRTFTIGYSDKHFNEIPYARKIAEELGTEHSELEVSDSRALEVTERLLSTLDEPIGDSSIIPTSIVCELARQSVKVAMSADGADELLGGYPRYEVCGRFADSMGHWMRFAYMASAEVLDLMPQQLIRLMYRIARRGGPGYAAIDDKVRKFIRMARSGSPAGAYDVGVAEFSEPQALSMLGAKTDQAMPDPTFRVSSGCGDRREDFMLADICHYLPGDLLTKLDRASMAVSLEAREPFLDHRMASIAAALPMRWKIFQGQGKYILRRILARHLRSDLFNRPKQGFSAPVAAWLRGRLRSRVETTLSAYNIQQIGLLDSGAVSATVERFMNDERTSAAGIWHILQLQNWAARLHVAVTSSP